jgi:hypothetical protein
MGARAPEDTPADVSTKAPKRSTPAKKAAVRRAPAKRTAARAAGKSAVKTAKRGGRRTAAQKAADAAAAEAKARGAVGPNGSDAQRAIRDGAIVMRLRAGVSDREVADEFGLAERTVREVREKRQAQSVRELVPAAILKELVEDLEDVIRAFRAIAYEQASRMPAVAVGALRCELKARRELLDLQLATGLVPHDTFTYLAEEQVRRIAQQMLRTMLALTEGEIDAEAALQVFREVVSRERQPPQLQASNG